MWNTVWVLHTDHFGDLAAIGREMPRPAADDHMHNPARGAVGTKACQLMHHIAA